MRLILSFSLLILLSGCHENEWIPIYQGEEELHFGHYLGIPDSSIHGLDLPTDSLGNYTKGFGYEDPLEVYTIGQVGGESVIRISGQVIGGLILLEEASDYHLRLKFKWGEKKWDWMKGRPKDGGILYHQKQGPIRHELQIHEGDVGSYWAKKVQLDIPSRQTTALPKAIQLARPYLAPYVSTLSDTMRMFDPKAPIHHFPGKNEWQIVIASPYNEKPHGEWNELEVICWKNHAVHIVNGKVNLILLNAHYQDQGINKPLVSGRITLQSEGAEIFFREIEYKKLKAVPAELTNFISPAPF